MRGQETSAALSLGAQLGQVTPRAGAQRATPVTEAQQQAQLGLESQSGDVLVTARWTLHQGQRRQFLLTHQARQLQRAQQTWKKGDGRLLQKNYET
jgi:hypothetical protein